MKKVIIILVFTVLALSCQEKEDVKPDVIEQEDNRGITIGKRARGITIKTSK